MIDYLEASLEQEEEALAEELSPALGRAGIAHVGRAPEAPEGPEAVQGEQPEPEVAVAAGGGGLFREEMRERGRTARSGGPEEVDAAWAATEVGGAPERRIWPGGPAVSDGAGEAGGDGAGGWSRSGGPAGGGSLWEVPRSGGGDGVVALYAGLARSRAAAGFVRRAAVVTVPAVENGLAWTPGPGAAELDRRFQRDARRYDGGFTLF